MFRTKLLGSLLLPVLMALTACTSPDKEAAIYSARMSLSHGDCSSAIVAIEPVYNSSSTDNEVRQLRASAQACAAGMTDFFTMVGTMVNNIAAFGGPQIWQLITQMFYDASSDSLDRRIMASW